MYIKIQIQIYKDIRLRNIMLIIYIWFYNDREIVFAWIHNKRGNFECFSLKKTNDVYTKIIPFYYVFNENWIFYFATFDTWSVQRFTIMYIYFKNQSKNCNGTCRKHKINVFCFIWHCFILYGQSKIYL